MKKARAMQLLRRASSLRLKAMTQPGRHGERKRSAHPSSSEVLGLLLMRHPGITERDVVHSSRDEDEAHAGEANGLPFSTM